MVNVTIDGKAISVPDGTTVLRAAEQAGIHIPVLCDHPHLVPFGGCRLCVVEVEGMRTMQPACSLPVSNNMIIRTDTEKVQAARKFVLTLIFSDRNHFCPYCQVSGGDCELQNNALALGMTHWDYQPNWKPYPVDASHPYLVLDHNRCILCRRCVRACGELVGNFTLGVEERGASSMLMCDVGVPFGESSCISCGTCSQVCPTGAIIDRRSAYQGLEKYDKRTDTVCLGCSVGCGVEVLTRDNRLVRILGDWDAPVNDGVICQLGRFAPLEETRARITTPLVRKNGKQEPVTWDEALTVIKSKVGKGNGGVAALASARLSAEALASFKQVFKAGLGGDVTSLNEGNDVAVAAKLASEIGAFETNLDALQAADCVVALGVDLTVTAQVMGFMVKRNLPNRATLVVIDSQENNLTPLARAALKPAAGSEEYAVRGLAAAVVRLGLAKGSLNVEQAEAALSEAVKKTKISAEQFARVAEVIGNATQPVFVYGKALDLPALKAAAELAAEVGASGQLLGTRAQANSLAAAQLGLDQPFKRDGHQAVYVALGDDEPSEKLLQKIEDAPFLAVQATYTSKLTALADVVLPVENWAETSGHYLSTEGRLQEAVPALDRKGEVRSNQAAVEAVADALGVPAAADWQAELSTRNAPVVFATA